MEDRKAFEAIVYVLRTGIQWNALPREVGASSTVHDRFQAWERAGFFKAVWQAGLSEYDELVGIKSGMASCGRSDDESPFRRRRDRSQPDRSRQTGNQAQPVD
jgi:putative transposase